MKYKIIILWLSLPLLCLNLGNALKAQCHSTEYSTNAQDSWLSCQTTQSPNSLRGNQHWLQYDLGYIYQLGATHFWNYNVTNLTGRGFKQVAIDYSMDGVAWTEAGTFQLPEAEGDAGYEGQVGLDLSGISARYVLITALSNWNEGTCAGLSEVRFDVDKPSTTCGDFIIAENMGSTDIADGTYYSNTAIESDGTIKNRAAVTFQSAIAISLKAGFTAEAGSQFLAKIETCNAINKPEEILSQVRASPQILPDIKIFPNPTVNILNIEFGQTVITDLMILTVSGHEILRRSGHQPLSTIDVSSLASGMYLVQLLTDDQQVISKRFIKAGL